MFSSILMFEVTNNDVEALMINTRRTNTMNEQSNLGFHHDLNMANLSTCFTLQQRPIVDLLIEPYQDGLTRVDDDLGTHYMRTIEHEIPCKGKDKPFKQRTSS